MASIEERKQQAFALLKATCVPLLSAAALPSSPTSSTTILDLLRRLIDQLSSIPAPTFTPALANYVFFPLSSLLQPAAGTNGKRRSDVVLEATMQALSVLVTKWRAASGGGMPMNVLHELWIMSILMLGGPLDPAGPSSKGKGKGKKVEQTDELKLAIVRVLIGLMRPLEVEQLVAEVKESVDEDGDPLGENIDWSVDDPWMVPPSAKVEPTPPTREPPPAPPIPIIFHTLTTLLELSATPTSLLPLQLASLEGLELLVEFYLAPHPNTSNERPPTGPSPFLATALPGTASTLLRIILSAPSPSAAPAVDQGYRQPSPVVVSALGVLSLLVNSTIGDSVTQSLRQEALSVARAGEATLSELVETFSVNSNSSHSEESPPPVLPPPSNSSGGPTLPTYAWFQATLSHIQILLHSLSALARHPNSTVRIAHVEFIFKLLQMSGDALGELKSVPLETLLALANDEWPIVEDPARAALGVLLVRNGASTTEVGSIPGGKEYEILISKIVKTRITGLPRALLRGEEKRVRESVRISIAALELLPTISGQGGGLEGIDRTCWALLRALAFERVAGVGESGAPEAGKMARGWIAAGEGVKEGEATDQSSSSIDNPESEWDWPTLRLRHARESQTSKDLNRLWRTIGAASLKGGGEQETVDLFLGIGMGSSRDGVAPSALWVLDGLLRGLKGDGDPPKRIKKLLKSVVRAVLRLLEQLEEEDDVVELEDLATSPPPSATAGPRTDLIPDVEETSDDSPSLSIEFSRGLSLTPSLDTLNPVSVSSTNTRPSQRILLGCLSLRLLATTASLLSSSFEPHLLQVLYHLLARISPTTHPLLRAHAQQALSRISYSTAYASTQNLVLANVDYVINSVSQRLSVSRLDPAAPLVLVEMIRLVGEPIVPMVQDLVEDVFEALDDYHGYDDVTVGLWAVLDALMRVMADGVVAEAGDGKAEKGGRPEREKEFSTFLNWFKTRNDPPPEEEYGVLDDDLPSVNPQKPFGATDEPNLDDGATGPPEFAPSESAPPTRPQTVAAQIISKALYFLSHSSPFLRSRVLSLMASAIPLLATPSEDDNPSSNRQADLLPVIHRAWPYILNRFSDAEPYVVLEAAALIEGLATHVGSFMSRRILDDVWPRFKTLLEKQEISDQQSPLAGRTPFTTSHRVYRSILTTMRHVARDVPLKEEILWEQALLFRRFLDEKFDPEIQKAARELYVSLGKVNQDVIWLVLTGSMDEGGEDLPAFLKTKGMKLEVNADQVLVKLSQ